MAERKSRLEISPHPERFANIRAAPTDGPGLIRIFASRAIISFLRVAGYQAGRPADRPASQRWLVIVSNGTLSQLRNAGFRGPFRSRRAADHHSRERERSRRARPVRMVMLMATILRSRNREYSAPDSSFRLPALVQSSRDGEMNPSWILCAPSILARARARAFRASASRNYESSTIDQKQRPSGRRI